VYAWLAFNDTQRGRWDEAERSLPCRLSMSMALPSPEPRANLRAYRGSSVISRGGSRTQNVTCAKLSSSCVRQASGTLLWHLGRFGLVLAELDRPDEAGACFEELHTLADALDGGSRARGFAFAHLAVGYARLGMREQAAGCYDKLLPFRGMVSPILVDRGLAVASGG